MQKYKFVINYGKQSVLTSLGEIRLISSKNQESLNLTLDEQIKEELQMNDDDEKSEIKDEILKQMLNNYISNCTNDPIKNHKFKIDLKNKEVVKSKPYIVPQKFEEAFKKELQKLQDEGILRKSYSNFATPCYSVVKKNGDLRIIVDYRKLNLSTISLNDYFPSTLDEINKFHDKKYFSTLDLKSGYYQVEIEECDKFKTAIITQFGKFEFNRVPFGLMNAPKYFNSMMRNILGDIKDVQVFVDDIIISSCSKEEHLKTLKEVLLKLTNMNIKLNIEKCSFFKTEVSYLGYIINEKGIQIDKSRLKHFEKWPLPTSRKKLQKLLGIINWYRPFLPGLSKKLMIFNNKLKKTNEKFEVNEQEKKLIEEIYYDVLNSNFLIHPNINEEFFLYTDASKDALGSVLQQKNGIVGYFSYKFNDAEKKYSTMEKELLSILLSLKHFRKIILGCKISVYTDNKNLIFLKEDFDKRINRWITLINEYSVTYEYIEGKSNVVADYISRNCLLQMKVQNIIDKKQDNEEFDLKEYLIEFHHQNGHPGIQASYNTLKAFLFDKKLLKVIKEEIRKCTDCQDSKYCNYQYGKSTGHLHTSNPLKDICSDIVGPYSMDKYSTNNDNSQIYIVTFIDRNTRFAKIEFIKKINASSIIKAFKKCWLKEFKNPDSILTDQGKAYMSSKFKQFCESNEIKHHKTSIYNPTGNSIAERINYLINICMRIYHKKSLKELKQIIENRLNNILNRSIGKVPYELVYNKHPYNIFNKRIIRQRNVSNKEIKYRKKKIINHEYKIGEKVYLKNFFGKKNDKLYSGPYEIIELDKNKNRILIKIKN